MLGRLVMLGPFCSGFVRGFHANETARRRLVTTLQLCNSAGQLVQLHDIMDALKKAIETPEVAVPLSWGACCAAAATTHAYASLFAAVPRLKTRVLRSLDVGFVVFALSSSLAFYNRPRTDE